MKSDNINLVEMFLAGLEQKSIEIMPSADDIVLISPLRPELPYRGREAVNTFLKRQVFPSFSKLKANIERHLVDENAICTLWWLVE